MGYLTPETIPSTSICRALSIPADDTIYAAVKGALLELTYERNWEEFGAVTPLEMSEAAFAMWSEFVASECMVQIDVFANLRAQGTNGGTITANTDTVAPFNTAYPENSDVVTLSGSQFVVPAGLYHYDIWHVVRGDLLFGALCWLHNASGAQIYAEGLHCTNPANTDAIMRAAGFLNLQMQQNMEFRVRSTDTFANVGLGTARNVAGHIEIYGQAIFEKLGDPV